MRLLIQKVGFSRFVIVLSYSYFVSNSKQVITNKVRHQLVVGKGKQFSVELN